MARSPTPDLGDSVATAASAASEASATIDSGGTRPFARRLPKCQSGGPHGTERAAPAPGCEHALDHDGDDEDEAVHDLQPRRVDLERGEQVLEQEDRERGEDDPDEPAAATGQRGPAEDDGGDCDERVLLRRGRVGRVHETGQGETADTREQAAQAVAHDAHCCDVHAGRERRRVVGADREEEAPVRDELEPVPDQQRQPDREQATRDRADLPGEVVDPVVSLAERHRVGRDPQVDPLQREVQRQAHDHRLNPQNRDQHAREHAHRETQSEHDRDGDRATQAVWHEPHDEDAVREDEQRGDRDVEAAADDRWRARECGERHWRRDRELIGDAEVPVVVDDRRDQQHREEQQREGVAVVAGESSELHLERAPRGRRRRDGQRSLGHPSCSSPKNAPTSPSRLTSVRSNCWKSSCSRNTSTRSISSTCSSSSVESMTTARPSLASAPNSS